MLYPDIHGILYRAAGKPARITWQDKKNIYRKKPYAGIARESCISDTQVSLLRVYSMSEDTGIMR